MVIVWETVLAEGAKLAPTVVLGCITTYIAVRQHYIAQAQQRTATEKLALDLFDKRSEVVNLVSDAIAEMLMTRDVRKSFSYMTKVKMKGRFLFGDDVNKLIDDMHKSLMDIEAAAIGLSGDVSDEEGRELKRRIDENKKIFNDSSSQFIPVCQKYMKMDQKLPGK